MSPSASQNDAERSEAIAALVDEFFERRQAGENLTPEQFSAEHPAQAEELRAHLAGLPLIDAACKLDSGPVARAPTRVTRGLPTIEGFDLIEEIGRGGMGIVYKARQLSTKRVVALKVISAGPFASESAVRRFEREVELAARLQHPSIVRILEGGEVAGQKYYAMDLVEGARLDHHLATARPGLQAILGILERICEAVDYAHGHGVVHRDLKPSNVLLDDEGNPHILDFGLAKATDQADTGEAVTAYVSLPGQVLGTLFYLSPEQATGDPDEIDTRTDVYALGVVLFEALTGSLPFDTSGRPSQVIQRILETSPRRPSSLSEQVDDEVETIILKALAKDKVRRYQSAGEMGEDIHRYLEGEPILAKRPSSYYVLRKKLRKHRWQVTLGAAIAALALIVLLTGSWSRQRTLLKVRDDALMCQRELERGLVGVAVGKTKALWERYPQLPEALLAHAQAMYRFGRPEDAIVLLQIRLQSDPSAWLYRTLLAEFYRIAGEAEQAAELQARADRDARDTAEAWYLRSFATLDLQRALQCVHQAVQRQPSHVLAWSRLTYLRLDTGDLDGALRGADQLIDLGANAKRWIGFKGRVCAALGRYREAIEHYTRVGWYLDRAHAYRRIGEYDQAIDDYARCLQLSGERARVWIYYHRATPLWIRGRTEEALADYRQVRTMRGRPGYADARAFLILREQDRQSEAEQVLVPALRDLANPRDDQEVWLREIFRCLDGQLAPGDLVANAVERNDHEHICEAYYYSGEVCLLSGNRAEARKWFEKCVQTGVEFDLDVGPATPMNEYELARWRLETLFADPAPSLAEEN